MIAPDEPFWRERMRRQKPRKVSLEAILRKCFKENMREYVSHCSLGGVKQMFEPGISMWNRLLWIAVFAAGALTCGYFLMYIWTDTLNRPLIVSLESSTYHISNVMFPAVAVCNVNRISRKAAHLFAVERYADLAKNNETLEEVEHFVRQLGRLLDYGYNETLAKKPIFSAMSDLYRKDTYRIIDTMKRLSPNCDELLVKCAWAGNLVDCKQAFITRRTIRGHCCTFNFILDPDNGGRPYDELVKTLMKTVKKQQEAGYLYGLNVILDPQLDDYAYPLSNMYGFDVLVFPPAHFPDSRAGRVVHQLVEPNRATYLELHTTTQRATEEVRKYSTNTRECLFRDESRTKFNSVYSYSTCIVQCRIATLQSLCKCTPYFINIFRKNEEENVCTLDDLRCLNKYKEKLWYMYPHNTKDTVGLEMEVEESLFCPDCLPECELTKHDVKAYETPLFVAGYPQKTFMNSLLEDTNMTNKCFMSVYHPVPDSTLDRLDVVSYWFEIISNLGGFGGIILGCSAISIVEIIYFWGIRYFICVFREYKELND